MDVKISIDAVSHRVLEEIRVGVDAAELMRNVDRFHEACRSVGSELRLTFCLMRSNWEEFAPVLAFAEERGLGVDVNVVDNPSQSSLLWLRRDELAAVVAALERATADVVGRLRVNSGTWSTEVARLRAHLAASGRDGGAPSWRDGIVEFFAEVGPADQAADAAEIEEAVDELRAWAGGRAQPVVLRVDPAGTVVGGANDEAISRAFRLPGPRRLGRSLDHVLGVLIETFGPPGAPEFQSRAADRVDFTNRLGGDDGVELRVVATPERDSEGRVSSVTLVGVAKGG
jgi:hypothetical protein